MSFNFHFMIFLEQTRLKHVNGMRYNIRWSKWEPAPEQKWPEEMRSLCWHGRGRNRESLRKPLLWIFLCFLNFCSLRTLRFLQHRTQAEMFYLMEWAKPISISASSFAPHNKIKHNTTIFFLSLSFFYFKALSHRKERSYHNNSLRY